MLADLYEKVGIHGTITIQEGKTLHHEIEFVDGLKFDRGYISPYFVTDEKKQKIEFENCYVLLVEKKLTNIRDILPFLEVTFQEQKPLLIIAEDIEGEALATLIVNKIRGTFSSVAVKAPGLRDDMCKSCACRPGTVPNGCLQTQLDLLKAASEGRPFLCHAPRDGRICAGWASVRAQLGITPLPAAVVGLLARHDYSAPDSEDAKP